MIVFAGSAWNPHFSKSKLETFHDLAKRLDEYKSFRLDKDKLVAVHGLDASRKTNVVETANTSEKADARHWVNDHSRAVDSALRAT